MTMPILFDEKSRTFKLRTAQSDYIMQVFEGGFLAHLYYGKRISNSDVGYLAQPRGIAFSPETGGMFLDTLGLEYPCAGVSDFREPCLQILDMDGGASCDLRYESHEIISGKPEISGMPSTFATSGDDTQTLQIICRDQLLNLEVHLYYSVFPSKNVITRSAKIINNSNQNIHIRRALSGCVDFSESAYDMITLNGAWGRERHVQRVPLHLGKQSVDSCRGASSHQHNPFAAIVSHETTETFGDAYGFNLVYSGNFDITAEVSQMGGARLVMGINPYGFNWLLEPEQSFETPEMVMVFSCEGLSGMSKSFHNLYRENLIRGKYKDIRRPVLVNNWEATYFDFNAERLLDIAKDAADLGIEMLVMDDGWFGKRDDDRSSLGDWFVNEKKLGCSLKELADGINRLGLKFGIWFEPEMVSPDSELFRSHPDWCLHVKDRDCSLGRNQLVLDMSRSDVRDYLFKVISDVLSGANIEYVKWDMNRHLTEVQSALLPAERARETYHRHILGVYDLMGRLTNAFPNILLENCSGGGGRFDPAMLYYSPQIWTSDDSDAIERIKIQSGTSLVYPLSTMGAHVSACPNHQVGRITPMETRGNVAMFGAFGYELDLTKLSDEEKAIMKQQIADYKKYSALFMHGDFYRLTGAFENGNFAAWQVVSKNKNETLVAYFSIHATCNKYSPVIKLCGLDPDSKYKDESSGTICFGDTLMNAGMAMPGTWGDYQSAVIKLTKIV